MSNQRDELVNSIMQHPWLPARLPFTGWCPSCPDRTIAGGHNSPSHAGHLADSILAAGYRKPRVINHHRDRAALPPGSICMDLDGNAWKRGTGSWVSTGEDTGPLYDEENLTLVVLHVGGQE